MIHHVPHRLSRLLAVCTLFPVLLAALPGQRQSAAPPQPIQDGQVVPGRWIVHFETGAEALGPKADAEFRTRVEALGGRVTVRWGVISAALVEIEDRRAPELGALPGVARLEADRWHVPTIKTSTDVAHHAADSLQTRGVTGKGATIALIDTGIDESIAGSPPHANPFPGLPGKGRLAPNTYYAVRVRMAAGGRLDAFDLWCGDVARPTLRVSVHADRNGLPDTRALATTSLAVPARPRFQSARLTTPLSVAPNTTLWFAFTTAAVTRDFYAMVDCGVESDVVVGTAPRPTKLALAWQLVVNGRRTRPHTSFADAALSTSRIVVHKKVGAVGPGLVDQHGSALAAVAAGTPWTSSNADSGHAPQAKIAAYACADDSLGNALTSTIVTAWEKVACDVEPMGIEVAVIGFSGSPNPLDAAQRAQDAVARNTDLLVVAASGNSGSTTTQSPACVNGISVGATDANKRVASFSGHGTVAQMPYPDLVAHGVRVVAPRVDVETSDYSSSGTSLAAAQVAGAATLIRAHNPKLSALETRAILLASSEASPGTSSGQVSTGAGCGYLRDDLAYLLATSTGQVGSDRLTRSRPVWIRDIPIRRGQSLAIAVAWSRHDSNRAAWSNLDMTLKDSRGATLLRSATAVSTQEFLRYTSQADEILTVEVRATTFDAPVEKFAYASTMAFGFGRGSARYSEFDTGCKGSGSGGGCPALKQSPKDLSYCPGLPPKTTFALLVQCPCSVTFKGFSLHCRASVPNTPVECYLFKSTGGLEPQLTPVASGTMLVQTAAGYYSVTFGTPVALSVAEAENFFLAFRTPDSATIWADHGTSKLGHHFEMPDWAGAWTGGDGYQGAITEYSWDWKTDCTPGIGCPGGPPPVIVGDDVPILGSARFGVLLEQGPPNGLAILMTGVEIKCIPLGPVGAGACSLCCTSIFNFGAGLDGRGGARIPFRVPQNSQLVGASFAQQWVVLDQNANGLGLTLTGLGRGLIGTQ